MFVFCDYDWPRTLLSKFRRFARRELEPQQLSMTSSLEPVSNAKKWIVTILIVVYAAIQLFLPFSHFITKVCTSMNRTQIWFTYIWYSLHFVHLFLSPFCRSLFIHTKKHHMSQVSDKAAKRIIIFFWSYLSETG